jgi:uncharacterized protein YnzC (UPF0291/DUF896 family)
MPDIDIERINELARVAKSRPLTEEEALERQALRTAYVEAHKASLRATLENTLVQYPDGTKKPLPTRGGGK